MKASYQNKMTHRIALSFLLPMSVFSALWIAGCSEPAAEVVEETDEYTFDEIMAQVAAEEVEEESP
ncbi:hypothetical protein Q31b_55240 [Novipirellula aureliae]|uniref:Secreted protein n=1 Tax=Novipirellula aureliae TaxID=2527966 RepID=A0A5C6DCS0_9BACT|nr:hypothetical protein Q31b_55240 [Novipirellula aureliae]